MSKLHRLLQGSRVEVADRARQDRLGYGPVLVSVFINIIVQLGLPDAGWTRVVSTVIAGGTLMLALYAAGVSRRILQVGGLVVILAVAGAIAGIASESTFGDDVAPIIPFMLGLVAPVAIARDLARQPEVTTRSVVGAATIYLLIGVFFGQLYTVLAQWGHEPFFAQGTDGTVSDRLYFSLVTISTVGYGDFTAGTQIGRAFCSAEALIGQLYLVTVISVLVGNLGVKRRQAGQAGKSKAGGSAQAGAAGHDAP